MYGRRYQYTFSIFCRKLENRMRDKFAYFFIQQTILALSRNDLNLLFTDHIVKNIRINACSIYYQFCLIHMILRADLIISIFFYNILNFLVQEKLYTVCTCIFCQCDRQSKRTYNAACRRIQRSHDLIRHLRFHLPHFITGNDLTSFHTIFLRFFQ